MLVDGDAEFESEEAEVHTHDLLLDAGLTRIVRAAIAAATPFLTQSKGHTFCWGTTQSLLPSFPTEPVLLRRPPDLNRDTSRNSE